MGNPEAQRMTNLIQVGERRSFLLGRLVAEDGLDRRNESSWDEDRFKVEEPSNFRERAQSNIAALLCPGDGHLGQSEPVGHLRLREIALYASLMERPPKRE